MLALRSGSESVLLAAVVFVSFVSPDICFVSEAASPLQSHGIHISGNGADTSTPPKRNTQPQPTSVCLAGAKCVPVSEADHGTLSSSAVREETASNLAASNEAAAESGRDVAPTRRPSRAFSVGKSPEADGLERICSAMAMEPQENSAQDETPELCLRGPLAEAQDLATPVTPQAARHGTGRSIAADNAATGRAAGACLPRGASVLLAQVSLSRQNEMTVEDLLR
jgi:hypothetical protein